MRKANNMSEQLYQGSVTFHDVAASFSAEEWSLLEEWQKELYRNVMRAIHAALQTMGFEIINPDVLFRIKKVKEVYSSLMDRSDSTAAFHEGDSDHLMGVKQERGSLPDTCRRKVSKLCSDPVLTPDILLRIKQEETSAFCQLTERSPIQSPDRMDDNLMFSSPTSKLDECPTIQPEIRSHKRLGAPIKQEEVDYVKVSVGGPGPEDFTVTSMDSNMDMGTRDTEEMWLNQQYEDTEAIEQSNGSEQENGCASTDLKELPGTDYILNGSLYKWSGWHNHMGTLSPLPQHRRERPYQCSECDKTFSELSRFLRHQISHTGGRPYHCRHCVKTFRQPYELMVHQRVHTGEKPYQCTVCGKKFIKNSILKVHQRIHTGERPYKCTQCAKSFVQSHHLKTHQKTHRGGSRGQNY
ncbi:zinc finger protein 84 isoform X2 [Xenopus laevis]|uniref:Zinc finger protein 84 isoform X2 n=1 Tax=Xenopus laevis TaxID=8355 RepID=A0A8J0U9D8_XENLA|nr:zinc finger protein 84 isoform X2 [Xenopus laevis]